MRAKRAADPTSVRSYQLAYFRSHPDLWARAAIKRRGRMGAALVETVQRVVVWERDKGVCGICGRPADAASWHLDHIVPLSRGGPHSYANTQVSHPFCNLSKGARAA